MGHFLVEGRGRAVFVFMVVSWAIAHSETISLDLRHFIYRPRPRLNGTPREREMSGKGSIFDLVKSSEGE